MTTIQQLEKEIQQEEYYINNRFIVARVTRTSISRIGKNRFFIDIKVQDKSGNSTILKDIPLVRSLYHIDDWYAFLSGGLLLQLLSLGLGSTQLIQTLFNFAASKIIAFLITPLRRAIDVANFVVRNYDNIILTVTLVDELEKLVGRLLLNVLEKHIRPGMRVLVYCPTGNPTEQAFVLGVISVQSGTASFRVLDLFNREN